MNTDNTAAVTLYVSSTDQAREWPVEVTHLDFLAARRDRSMAGVPSPDDDDNVLVEMLQDMARRSFLAVQFGPGAVALWEDPDLWHWQALALTQPGEFTKCAAVSTIRCLDRRRSLPQWLGSTSSRRKLHSRTPTGAGAPPAPASNVTA